MVPEGSMYRTVIEGRTFVICTERNYDYAGHPGGWRAWCFLAYDRFVNIFPADTVPDDVVVQESIAGESASTEDEARLAVEETIRTVMRTRNLDGTGFYSPPGGFVYPQGIRPPEQLE